MAQDCVACQIIGGNIPAKVIFEDDSLIAILNLSGAAPGHALVMPKEHFTILEQVPDPLCARLFTLANNISTAIFETNDIKGTNIFVANGIAAGQTVPNVMVHVVPRDEDDGINLLWDPKRLSEEEMSTVELQLREQASGIGVERPPVKERPSKPQPSHAIAPISKSENYLIKSARRIP